MKLNGALLLGGLGLAMSDPYTSLEGAGTTNPSRYLWKIADTFETRIRGPTKVGYRGVGSGTGQQEFVGKSPNYLPVNDFGAGDIPLCVSMGWCRVARLVGARVGLLRARWPIPFRLACLTTRHTGSVTPDCQGNPPAFTTPSDSTLQC
jgi:hypothetical protein